MSSLARSSVTLSTRMPRAIRCRAPSLRRFVAVTAASGKQVIATDKAVAALGPYSQAIKVRIDRVRARARDGDE